MKKVGILFGMEDTFPWAFIEKVNELGKGEVVAEPVKIDKVQQGIDYGYSVIFDRISQDVPFYRAYLKNAALMGTDVINNPFWWSADEKFFNNCLMTQIGIPVPKTVLLPSKERPDDTSEKSFRNLQMMDWEYIFNYIGFPAYMKPFSGGGWKNVYRVENPEDLWNKLDETGQLVMMLQEEIEFDDYYRIYCLGQKYVKIMPYEPRNPHHLRYQTEPKTKGADHDKLMKMLTDYTLKINKALGYDFNTVEFAIRNGVPYAIDFCNPAPDADIKSVGEDNFNWVVEHAAKLAVERAKAQKPGKTSNISWGDFVKESAGLTTEKPKSRTPKKVAKTPVVKKTKSTASTKKVAEKKPEAASKTTAKKTSTPKKVERPTTSKTAAKATPKKSTAKTATTKGKTAKTKKTTGSTKKTK